jgi:hypothetical protein
MHKEGNVNITVGLCPHDGLLQLFFNLAMVQFTPLWYNERCLYKGTEMAQYTREEDFLWNYGLLKNTRHTWR